MKGDLAIEHLLFEQAQYRGPQRRAPLSGNPGRNVKKGPGYGHLSIRAPLHPRGTWNQEGGSYTRYFE
jgi:hypothetical protein